MPRIARVVVPGCPHHITQRGNNRSRVFFVDEDRRVYLEMLKAQSQKHGLGIDGYCLMANHIHLIATPRGADSLAKVLGITHLLYTQHVNRMHGRSGHLWQNRFYSCALDETHYWSAMIYVERNPLRAGLARRPWRYPWSSAGAHCGMGDKARILDLAEWGERLPAGLDWRESLSDPVDEEALRRMRLYTSRGRPLGADRFVAKMEKLVGRRLRPLPRGRPPKSGDRCRRGNARARPQI